MSQLPAALRRPQKKHAPGFLRHASSGFCLFAVPLGSLWLPLGCPWAPFGLPLAAFGEPLGHIGSFIVNWTSFTEKCVKFMKLSTKHSFLEFARRARGARRARQSGVMKCGSDPPLPHALGARMMGVKQTPSKHLVSVCYLYQFFFVYV